MRTPQHVSHGLGRHVAFLRSPLGRWLFRGGELDTQHPTHTTHPWYLVLWLTGVDYFSTLGYQPGIALLAAGALSPIATVLLVVVTLCGALPIYAQVAKRSYAGQGSIAMLENLLGGWSSKVFVLILLGFAATDFVITITLSAADASQHAIENPLLHHLLAGWKMPITMGLIALLTIVFLKGFSEALGVAAVIAIPYLLLNIVVLGRGFLEIVQHPAVLATWQAALWKGHTNWGGVLLAAAVIFPKLALGLSGFETGVSVMSLVSGGPEEDHHAEALAKAGQPPYGRIYATRSLLTAAALIMSVLLIASSIVTTLLVPEEQYRAGGDASGRALAYLAHLYLGSTFGTVYDIATILILWFAGASAMAGLLSLIPRYLPRFGMAPRWVGFRRPLVLVLFLICLLVTWIFKADVEAQGGAYATGVLALMLSAAVAVAIALHREESAAPPAAKPATRLSWYFWGVSLIFAFTFIENVLGRPDGVYIASAFIFCVLAVSAVSRYQRATELRVAEYQFANETSRTLWQQIRGKKVNLVPLRLATPEHRAAKGEKIRSFYQVEGPLAFIHVNLLDNRSEFRTSLNIHVSCEGDNYIIEVSGATAIANTIAYISELLKPLKIFLGLTRLNLMTQSFNFLIWGEGETGLMVYKILLRYWDWTPGEDTRPLIFLISE